MDNLNEKEFIEQAGGLLMPKEPMKRKVTKKEIDNAIFVDFEGAKTGTNTEPDYSDPNCRKFVGMMWKTNYVNLDQFILEPSLKICATIYGNAEESLCEEHRVRWFTTRENAESPFIKELLKREGRLIISSKQWVHGHDDEGRRLYQRKKLKNDGLESYEVGVCTGRLIISACSSC